MGRLLGLNEDDVIEWVFENGRIIVRRGGGGG